jgi:L-fucose isomerase-like protein
MKKYDERMSLTPTIGLTCVARPTFAVDYARELAHKALASLGELGCSLVGDAELLMDAGSARAAAQRLQAHQPDILVILCATFSDASMVVELANHLQVPICLWAVREPGPVGDRLWLNSLCGANISAHALQQSGHVTTYIYGDPGEEDLLRPLIALARAAATRQRLRHSRIGLVGQAPTGFYGCQFDELNLAEVIGTSVTQIDLARLFEAASRVVEDKVEAAIASTAQRSTGLRQLNASEVQRFGEAYVVLKEMLETQDLDGLAVRCWPEFPQQFGLMPCATLGRLADDGFVCACEADMHGAVTMLALQWLSGNTPFLADVVALDKENNTISLWHCGNASACLAADGDPVQLTIHCNRRIGVAGNFSLRSGAATLARLGVGTHGYRLLYVEGEILEVPANRFMGNTAVFRPQCAASTLLDTIMFGAWEHHMALVPGHIAPELAALARLWGIEAVSM